jgi:hypothetical protein
MKPELIDKVWQHGRVVPEADDVLWREDACGAWMLRDHFGREDSEFGWKIEKISIGEGDTAEALRPFNVRNHYDIALGRTHCRVTADRSNVPAEKYARPPRNRLA